MNTPATSTKSGTASTTSAAATSTNTSGANQEASSTGTTEDMKMESRDSMPVQPRPTKTKEEDLKERKTLLKAKMDQIDDLQNKLD